MVSLPWLNAVNFNIFEKVGTICAILIFEVPNVVLSLVFCYISLVFLFFFSIANSSFFTVGSMGMQNIFGTGHYLQIKSVVVRGIKIFMVNMHSLFTPTYELFSNKSVNISIKSFSVETAKNYSFIPRSIIKLFKNSLWNGVHKSILSNAGPLEAFYSPQITNLVKTPEFRYVFPCLSHLSEITILVTENQGICRKYNKPNDKDVK